MINYLNYEQAISYVHSLTKFGSILGLDRISKLLEMIDNPQNNLKFIHIAGTNGKGSVTAICANILKKSGYRVGMYISPYVVDFSERFQINGNYISKDDLVELISIVKSKVDELNNEGITITEFEFITAVAFLYFNKYACDIVCLEVGIGGLYDATNVINSPLACVITSISLDHTQILGENIYQIATQKAGIIKENSTVVVYPLMNRDAFKAIQEKSEQTDSVIKIAYKNDINIISCGVNGTSFTFEENEYFTSLVGEHQAYNSVLAIQTMQALVEKGYSISDDEIKCGLRNINFAARFEVINQLPLIVLDGSHNFEGVKGLQKTLSNIKAKRLFGIVAMLEDKDYENSIKLISPLFDTLITVEIENQRAVNYKKLADVISAYNENALYFKEQNAALEFIKENLTENDALIVFGSLYLASEIREKLMEFVKKHYLV